ncbi:MAG: hypothetical protein H0V81_11190 [Solirubrobacterales bacterium]|nr:hypothetical protein [Solirubrobacterales bacterium]
MSRVRISATVDADELERARRLTGARDSQLLDEALVLLVRERLAAQEREALTAQPYDADPDLAWQAPPGPDLPYEGEIPAAVLALAKARRRRR